MYGANGPSYTMLERYVTQMIIDGSNQWMALNMV